ASDSRRPRRATHTRAREGGSVRAAHPVPRKGAARVVVICEFIVSLLATFEHAVHRPTRPSLPFCAVDSHYHLPPTICCRLEQLQRNVFIQRDLSGDGPNKVLSSVALRAAWPAWQLLKNTYVTVARELHPRIFSAHSRSCGSV